MIQFDSRIMSDSMGIRHPEPPVGSDGLNSTWVFRLLFIRIIVTIILWKNPQQIYSTEKRQIQLYKNVKRYWNMNLKPPCSNIAVVLTLVIRTVSGTIPCRNKFCYWHGMFLSKPKIFFFSWVKCLQFDWNRLIHKSFIYKIVSSVLF